MTQNILLLTCPLDDNYYIGGINDGPVLGLLALENYVCRNMRSQPEINIIDGEHNSLFDILRLIRLSQFDLVGLQPMMGSYKNSLKIAKEAKQSGALVIMGGHHVSQLSLQIAYNRREIVDYVVVGDGEEALLGLIQEKPIHLIPNLVYWDKTQQKVVSTVKRNTRIDASTISYISDKLLEQYKEHYSKLERGKSRSFRVYSHKGCSNRMNSEYCFFCGRADKGVRFKSPKVYMNELKYLVECHNADYIWEVGDDFLQNKEYIEKLISLKNAKYSNLNFHLKIFARANRIAPGIIKFLHTMNVQEVAIGFESGSDKILKNINKNINIEQNINAAKLLYNNKIDIVASFVLGLPGEDEEPLRHTYELALRIADMSYKYLKKPPQEVVVNLIEVIPGSPAFKKLQQYFPQKYLSQDLFDVTAVQNDYFMMVFKLKTLSEVYALRAVFAKWGSKINKLGKYSFPAGWCKGELNFK